MSRRSDRRRGPLTYPVTLHRDPKVRRPTLPVDSKWAAPVSERGPRSHRHVCLSGTRSVPTPLAPQDCALLGFFGHRHGHPCHPTDTSQAPSPSPPRTSFHGQGEVERSDETPLTWGPTLSSRGQVVLVDLYIGIKYVAGG